VSNRGKIRYVFTSSNTSAGFVTFIPDLIKGLRKLYVLKGPPGSGKSTFIRLVGESLLEQGFEIEFWVSPLDLVNPEGVYIPRLEAAVINGSLQQPVDPPYPGITGQIVNLDAYLNRAALQPHSRAVMSLVDQIEEHQQSAFHLLKQAGRVKEELKKEIAVHLSMERIQQVIDGLANAIFQQQPGEKHYFASAVTAEGIVNYIDEISKDCRQRYILKGPPGSGKSTIIQELARRARAGDFFLEYYHCGFEAENLSMVIIRNLEIALIDAGQLELTPRSWDTVLEMADYLDGYDLAGQALQSSEIHRNYENLLQQGQATLEKAQHTRKELKKLYASNMDFTRLDTCREKIVAELSNRIPGLGRGKVADQYGADNSE
jgi:hypothetical protein